MPAGKRETVIEQNSFSGSVSPTYKMGETAYSKFFDNTSGKWERWSGSGAPTVASRLQIHSGSDYTDIGYSGSDLSIPVTVIAGDIEFGTIAITGSTVTFPVTGSVDARQSGSWNVDARQSGSWGVGVTGDIGKSITGSVGLSITGSTGVSITGSSTIPTTLGGTAVSGSVGITGSATLPVNLTTGVSITGSSTIPTTLAGTVVSGSIGITGSSTLNVSVTSDMGKSITGSIGISITGSTIPFSGVVSGSVGITGSSTLSVSVTGDIGKSITGSIGLSITGSSTLPTSLVGTAISGSVGITGSATLPIQGSVNITGSTFFAPISKLSLFNTGSSANTAIIATALSPTNTPTLFRIYACFASGSTFMVTRLSGSVTGSEYMNSAGPLTASGSYMFDILVDAGETINFKYGTGSTIIKLSVIEKDGAG